MELRVIFNAITAKTVLLFSSPLKDAPLHDILVRHMNVVSLPKNFEKIKRFLESIHSVT